MSEYCCGFSYNWTSFPQLLLVRSDCSEDWDLWTTE